MPTLPTMEVEPLEPSELDDEEYDAGRFDEVDELVTCPTCEGVGGQWVESRDYYTPNEWYECPTCGGEGEVRESELP